MERRMYNPKTGEITGIDSPELREIQKRLRSMRTLIEAEKRLPTDDEMEEIRKLDERLSQPADPVKARAMRPDPSDLVHGPVLASEKRNIQSYELRGPGESKEFRSLFGTQPLNTYRWKDKEISFYQAVFSGRMHPDLITRSMWESIGSQGGFLVPVEHSERIHNISLEDEIVQPRSFVQPMKTNAIDIPAMTIGNHSSNLWGGFTASYVGETGTISEASPTVRKMELRAKKLTGRVRFSRELIDDIPGGEGQLETIIGKGLAWYRDKSFLKGSGAGEPLGVLNSGCLIAVSKETGQGSGTILYENLTKMLARLHPACFKNSVWVAHQSTIPQLLSLSVAIGTGGDHIPVLREVDGGFQMLTRPVLFTEKTETLGNQGDLLLADFSHYVVGLREELRLEHSIHVRWSTDEVEARLIERHDGQPLWDSALTLEDGSTTVSPFVVIQDR